MTVVAVVGAQWGDEGKAKILDAIGRDAALIAQYAGGYHPGFSLVAEGERHVFHVAPADALRRGTSCLLAQGMALEPRLLLDELDTLEKLGVLSGELLVDQRAAVVLPHHIELDRLRDEQEGASGTPRRGLGPAYGDKVFRRGVRMGDLLDSSSLETQVKVSVAAWTRDLEALGGEAPDVAAIVDAYGALGERMKKHLVDGSRRIDALSAEGKLVLLEGPYGTMVDEHHGYYPFVVGASTVVGGACTGTGISPRSIDKVIGVAKAYITRPGSGPLPSEVTGDLATRLTERGSEISPTTAKPRRTGMFDLAVLRYAARVNGFDTVALTKLDVLSGFDEIPVCTGYELDGEVKDEPPFEGQSRMQPLVEMLPGWSEDLSECRSYDELPENARKYVEFIEQNGGVSVDLVSVGPDRAQTIERRPVL